MKCKRCNQKLGDKQVIFKNYDGYPYDYYLCNECATELLQDAQSAREEDE